MTTSHLSEVCVKIVDCEHKTAPIDPAGDYYAIGTPAMRSNRIDFGEARRISRDTYEQWTRRLAPEPGDILFAREAPVGPAIQIPDENNVAPGQRTVLLRPDESHLISRYLYYWLISPQQQTIIDALSAGSTVAHLNVADVRTLQISPPILVEQQAIAEVLGALDDKIAANTKLATTFEDLASTEFDVLGLCAENVRGTSVTEIVDFNPRHRVGEGDFTKIDMQALPTSTPLVDSWVTGLKTGGARFQNGDTLLGRITPCLQNRKTGFVDFLSDGEVGIGSTEFIVMRSAPRVPSSVSYFLAINDRFRDYAMKHMTGTSGRQRVSAQDLTRFEINDFNFAHVQKFGEWADTGLAHLGRLRNENRTLSATRDALLPQLMSGKLCVRDAEKVLEEAGV